MPSVVPYRRECTDAFTGERLEVVYALPPELLGQHSQAAEGIPLSEIVLRVWQGRWWVIASTALGMMLAVVYALSQPNQYTASVTALPPAEGSKGGLGQYAGLAAMAGISLPGGTTSSVDEIMAILGSRRLQEPLITEHHLAPDAPNRDVALQTFRAQFQVRQDKRANTIVFSFTHQDPRIAAEVVNDASRQLSDIFNSIHHRSAQQEVAFLESRLAETDAALLAAASRLAQFQSEHRTISLEAQTQASVEALAKLQGELMTQQVELRSLLASQTGADNPRVQLLRESVAALTDQMQRLFAGNDSGVLLGLADLPELGIQYLMRYREVKKYEAVLQGLTTQLEVARLNQVRESEAITIIDPAVPPEQKSGPRRSLIVLAGTLLAALVGLGLALVSGLPWRTGGGGETPQPQPETVSTPRRAPSTRLAVARHS